MKPLWYQKLPVFCLSDSIRVMRQARIGKDQALSHKNHHEAKGRRRNPAIHASRTGNLELAAYTYKLL